MLTTRLATTLQNLQSPGGFYANGTLEIFPPCIEVDQVGRISLPLIPVQAEQLVQVAEQAPYGKGYETLVDTKVRRTWQLDAKQVSLSGKYWQKNLSEIVSNVKLALGVDCEILAELYKLLVYDTGSFFTSHRDTEKADGMFATLVIVLPSAFSGGELVVRHQQDEVTLDLCCQQVEEISYAAFYADCVHEVLPVTEGCRLTLVYNLIRTDKKIPLPTPPDYHQAQYKMAGLLKNWVQQLNENTDEEQIPDKLIYLLEHEYSIAELKFDALKNRDLASAEVLIPAAEQAGCDLYLALVSVEESGYAEHVGGGYYNRWGSDDEDNNEFEIGEVLDHWETISEWRSPDGSQPTLPTLSYEAKEFCPPEAFDKMEPDDVEFQEATGNAGASFERIYHCAALVLWPRSRFLTIINQGGLNTALPVLNDLCQQWKNNKKAETKQNAQTLAFYILRDWLPEHCAQFSSYSRSDTISDFLNCLICLTDIDLLNHFCSIVAEKGIYQKEHSLALAKALVLLPWIEAVGYVTDIISVGAAKAQDASVVLLSSLCSREHNNDKLQQLSAAAQALFMALPGDTKRFPDIPPWQQQRMAFCANDVADMIVSFSMINVGIAETTLNYMLAWPVVYGMDEVLLPAALQIVKSAANNELSVVARLRQIVVTHLRTRLAEQLEPPIDWKRDDAIDCSCKDCRELKLFLNNSEQKQWRFKAAETRRNHIQNAISRGKSDIDYVTEKQSRPYSMVCTKNMASYQRRVEQSEKDKATLARLLED